MISDEQLRTALEEYDEAILSALPESSDCDHHFSKGFRRKMRRVRRRAKHPMVYKTLQRAACILLALLALFGGMVAFNAEVRAAVIDWIHEQIGHFSHYFYAGETNPEPEERKRYELGSVPDGYMLIDSLPGENSESLIYVNGSAQILQFCYYYDATDGPFIGGVNYTQNTVSIGDHTADIYLSLDPNSGSAIVWTDAESGVLFYISASVSEEDLMKLAAGVTEKD